MIHRKPLGWQMLAEPTLALGSGLIVGLATPPACLWAFAWVGLAPLWALSTAPVASWRRRFVTALAWGAGYHGLTLFWITGVHPLTWMGIPWPASLAIAGFCWVVIVAWGAALAIAWSLGLAALSPYLGTVATRVAAGVALWCALERLWSLTPLWWSSLALTQSPHNLPILQWSQLSGPTTVVAAIVACNGLLAESWQSRRWGWLLWTGMAVLTLQGSGWVYLNRPLADDPNRQLQVGIIQGNIPNEIKLYPQGYLKAISGYARGYATLADRGVDAILAPETALPFFWSADLELAKLQRDRGVPLWVGAFGKTSKGGYANSLFSLASDGGLLDRFDKVRLVPLGEYVPFGKALDRFVSRLSPIQARLVPGERAKPLETPFGKAIVGICYESAYSHHFRQQSLLGGEFILSAANNAHYSPAMPAQHHAQDVLRAIETDRWAVRAANTGYSGIVDPRGRTRWRSELDRYTLYDGQIARRQTLTPYARWGDWLLWVAIGAAVFGCISQQISCRRARVKI